MHNVPGSQIKFDNRYYFHDPTHPTPECRSGLFLLDKAHLEIFEKVILS